MGRQVEGMIYDLDFLEDVPEDADNYEVERTESDADEGCEGGACKI